jgi:hypothetical protein
MDLKIDDVERYLCKIFEGVDFIRLKSGDEYVELVLKHPDNVTKIKASHIYQTAYDNAVEEGILPMCEMEKLIRDRGLFSEEDEKKLEALRDKLHAQRVLLSKTSKVKARVDRIKDVIKDLETQIRQIEYKRLSKLAMSAETKAEEDRSSYLCWASVYDSSGESLYWKSQEDFLNEKDIVFRGEVLNRFLSFYSGIDTTTIRYIARHSLWRIRFVTSQKTSEPLFGVPTSQYTNDMMNLAYWSNFYQNVYEMLPEDRPSDLIIEDDASLDAYMKDYYEERNRDDAARKSKQKTRGKLSAFDREEVVVTQSHELYEDIDYDKPREAKMIKEKTDVRKKARRRR